MNRKLIWTLGTIAVVLVAGVIAFQHFWIYIPGVVGRIKNPIQPFHEVAWGTGAAPTLAPGAKRPPNVIVIVADDLGINDLQSTGQGVAGGAVPTPNIDSLSRDGLTFTNGYAGNATCSPSRAAMMTGRYPIRFGFEFTGVPVAFAKNIARMGGHDGQKPKFYADRVKDMPPVEDLGVPSSEVTLAETMKSAGYRTLHIGKWHLGEAEGMRPENQGFDEKPVQLGSRSFRLLFGNEFREGFNCLQVARVSRNASGKPMMHPGFAAPCLDLSSSELLMNLIRRQVEVLASKSSALAAPRREKSKGSADFTASDTASFWLLHTVNSYLPELRHIFKVRRGHPEFAYCAMLRLAGALSTFAIEGSAAELPDYNHDDLGACFSLLDARIRDLMDTVIPDKFYPIPLIKGDRATWSGAVPDDNLFHNSQFYLALSAPMGIDEIIQRVPTYLKLAAPDDLERLVRNSLPGISLRHVEHPPKQIPMKLGNQYFTLNQSGDMWKAIMLARRVAVFAPAEVKDPVMELIVVGG